MDYFLYFYELFSKNYILLPWVYELFSMKNFHEFLMMFFWRKGVMASFMKKKVFKKNFMKASFMMVMKESFMKSFQESMMNFHEDAIRI